MMSLWGVGQAMIIFLAGLQGIDDVYYEAAKIDGAGWWQQMWHITIPMMSSVIFFNLILGVIGSFQVFTAGYLITDGGPQNATLFYVLYLYRVGFQIPEDGICICPILGAFLHHPGLHADHLQNSGTQGLLPIKATR